jgi:hypothetical protein
MNNERNLKIGDLVSINDDYFCYDVTKKGGSLGIVLDYSDRALHDAPIWSYKVLFDTGNEFWDLEQAFDLVAKA